jgi:hypothetical protein
MTFLSFYHSWKAIKEIQKDNPDIMQVVSSTAEVARMRSDSKLKRFKTAVDMLNRFCDTKELASPPLRAALRHLHDVVQEVRDDIIEAEQWVTTDIREALHTHSVNGAARDALLALFGDIDGADRESCSSCSVWETAVPGEIPKPRSSTKVATPFVAEPWGWNTLTEWDVSFHNAVESIFMPTVIECIGADAIGRGRKFLEILLRSYDRSHNFTYARGALALRASYWLAKELNLWDALHPVERVAVLVSAIGLNSEGGAAVFTTNCLVERSAAAAFTLEALRSSGLLVDENAVRLRQLVCRAILRARPRCMLEDAQALHKQKNKLGQLSAAAACRSLIISVVTSVASYSFLALPKALHEPWAQLCHEEVINDATSAGQESLDVACWIRALIEILMLPMCEALGVLDGAGTQIAELQRCLDDNSKVWKSTKLAAVQPSSLMEPEKFPDISVDASGKMQIEFHEESLLTRGPPPSKGTSRGSSLFISTVDQHLLPGQTDTAD